MPQIGGHRKPGNLGGIPFLAHPIVRSQQSSKLMLQHEPPAGRQKPEYAQQFLSG